MNNYLIPANSKKSQLYFGLFRGVDFGVLGIGILITLVLVFAIPGDTLLLMVLKLLPLGITVLLVMPVANYHNVLVYIQEIINFYSEQKRFKWKGWCMTSARYAETERDTEEDNTSKQNI